MDKVKVFISYCHEDESSIPMFLNHISSLTDKDNLAEVWYDRDIKAGNDFWAQIDAHLADRDIVCLLLSASYLASDACKEEMSRAMKMRAIKNIVVFPIVLSPCAWLEYDVNKCLAATKDGTPISSYEDSNGAWFEVYTNLRKTIDEYMNLKNLSFSADFEEQLKDATLLTKAHANKEDVTLDDIFVYPELTVNDIAAKKEQKIGSFDLINSFSEGDRISICGVAQSGKTSLAKRFVKDLRAKGFIPILLIDFTQGNLKEKIARLFNSQYDTDDSIDNYDQTKIVPVFDDFFKIKPENREKHIGALSEYKSAIVIVDDVFFFEFKNEKLMADYKQHTIRELKPSLRDALIKKWISLSDNAENGFVNEMYHQLDEKTELVNTGLGKVLGGGIMPAYPFFILSLISTYDTLDKPLDKEITSQGFCYQSLIYFFLRKHGVSNEDVDTYVNFLTEFAYAYYQKRRELTNDEFEKFVADYKEEYNLTVGIETIKRVLSLSNILRISSLNNYSFEYPYLYYYFAGKYFAEHLDDVEENQLSLQQLNLILDNLHKDENAYIAIFVSHHAKSKMLQTMLLERANKLFANFKIATLDKSEMIFFDLGAIPAATPKQIDGESSSPETHRSEILARQDEIEESRQKEEEDIETEIGRELRRSIKTVEVVGHIIKNRAGSLKKTELSTLFTSAMCVNLRMMSSFFELIKIIQNDDESLTFLQDRIKLSLEKEGKTVDEEKLKQLTISTFWKINFGVILGVLDKTRSSLGSDKLKLISNEVCDSFDTPATFIVKHSILMWYSKNLQIEELRKINSDNFSEVSRRTLRVFIMQHCRMHQIDYKDKPKIAELLGVNQKALLFRPDEKK